MATKYGFCRFWTETEWPPEMTPLTPGSGYMNQKTIEMDRYDPFLVPGIVQWCFIIDWRRLLWITWQKSTVLVHFWQNYPRKWPRWPPGGRTENLKTVKYVRSDPYLVCKLHKWRLNSIWGYFFKQNCQKTYILGHFLYKCIGKRANKGYPLPGHVPQGSPSWKCIFSTLLPSRC